MDHLELFTDGGAIKIDDKIYGSSAYVIRFKNRYFISGEPVTEGNSERFELKAIRDGLKAILSGWLCDDNMEVWIVTDCKMAILSITELFDGWTKKNGTYYNKNKKEVLNIDLILEIRELLKYIKKYRFVKIKSHIDTTMIDATYEEFKSINNIDLSFTRYLMMARFNEMCDSRITKEINYKKRKIANRRGVQYV